MKKVLLLLLFGSCLVWKSRAQQGFSSVTDLAPLPIASSTGENPQSKVWSYAGRHWCVLATSSGTIVFRLDGNSWTNVLVLASGSTAKPDIKVINNLVHLIVYKGSVSILYSLEYDPATQLYKLWSKRKTRVDINLESGVQTSNIDIDATGRMWLASDGTTEMYVRWSDSPYSTWSAPIVIATGTHTSDICTVVAMPTLGKVGVFWSNKVTKRFGFRTHIDSDDPQTWSADELPASQSALSIGGGFVDNQFNLKATDDGTVYAAVKTSYNTAGYPQIGLLVRRPDGSWDPLYAVNDQTGSKPVVLVNDSLQRIKVIYTASSGNIVYRESSVSGLVFGSEFVLINGVYDNTTSIKANYHSEVVILASNSTTAVGVLGVDRAEDLKSPQVLSINRQSPQTQLTSGDQVVFRISFSEAVSGVDENDLTVTTVDGSVSGQLATGSVSTVNSTNAVYDVTVSSIMGYGTLRLDLNNSSTGITDTAGNALTTGFNTGQTYIFQPPAPVLSTVTIGSDNPSSSLAKPGNTITIDFISSEPINTPIVTIANHSATITSISTSHYTAQYLMDAQDAAGVIPFTIDFTSSSTGATGMQVTTTTDGSSVLFDPTAPVVNSINRQTPATEFTSASSVTFRVTFSEPVNGVDESDFSLVVVSGTLTGTPVIGSVTGVNGTDAYDVTINSLSGNATIRLDLKAQGTNIYDAAGNAETAGFNTGQSYTIQQTAVNSGFASVMPLTPVPITVATKDKPQSKVWTYAGKWWCVLSVSDGTKVYRLDGSSWTPVLLVSTASSKSDVRIVGDVVHLLLFKGANKVSFLYSIQYDPDTDGYKFWTTRPGKVSFTFPAGAETATMALDGNGRMWFAAAGTNEAYVWWSDSPYTTWSNAIKIATGIKDDDICAITPIPALGKIGVIWSNQNSKRFGFRMHTDGANPNSWSSDEVPASQSAIDNVGYGMADDHLNIKIATDGTLYCAAKTGYNKTGYPKVIMLVRRPSGTWDDMYTVSMNPEGTQPEVILNEKEGKLKVVYASIENGGDILYRESSLDNISFSEAKTLISGGGYLYDYSCSTHQNYTSEIVILATNVSTTPLQAVGVLATDIVSGMQSADRLMRQTMEDKVAAVAGLKASPNPSSGIFQLQFALPETGQYRLEIYQVAGRKIFESNGFAVAGTGNLMQVNGSQWSAGMYFVTLTGTHFRQSIKLIKK